MYCSVKQLTELCVPFSWDHFLLTVQTHRDRTKRERGARAGEHQKSPSAQNEKNEIIWGITSQQGIK